MIDEYTECPYCKSKDVVFQDDSFDHEFGIEVIQFWYCKNCNWESDE